MEFIYAIIAILVFTFFDIIGFHFILTKGETIKPTKINNAIYRIIQVLVQIGISVILYLLVSPLAMIIFLINWWLGVCDMLFYIFLGQNFIGWNEMYWLWWTPIGLVYKIQGKEKEINYKHLIIQASIAILITITLKLFL